MRQLKHVTVALAAVFALGLLTNLQAQTRTVTFNTAAYEYKANQVSAGVLSDNTRYATFTGEAKAINNKVAASLRSVTITVLYTVDTPGAGTVTGGTWSLTTLTKDRPAQTFGGDIPGGLAVSLQPNDTLGQGNFFVTLLAGDPDWPISGSLAGALDKSRPARLAGTLILTYPVVQ